jgi:WD repeat-containing protein 45
MEEKKELSISENKEVKSELSKNIIHIGFNQDNSCFVCVYENGFKVFTLSPLKETFSHKFDGTIQHVEMLFKTNMYAIIGGGENPLESPNKLILWDVITKKKTTELSYRHPVIGVKWKRDKLIVSLPDMVYIYHLTSLRLFTQLEISNIYETSHDNLIVLHPESDKNILITPSTIIGCITVYPFDDKNNTPYHIPAHQSEISYIVMNQDATLVATSSIKGTLIRVFDLKNSKLVHEFRRGIDMARINNICFDPTSKYLIVSSNKGTIHIYSLETTQTNTKSFFSPISGVLPQYFSSEWSYKQVKLPKLNDVEFKICVDNEVIYIVTYLGGIYTINLKDLNQDTIPINENSFIEK